jgi:Transposase zinc-ribbon domain/ISXO2-like transposase domain
MSLPDPVKLARALQPPKTLREFTRHFSTEVDCEEFLFLVRYPEGFACPRCGIERGWPLNGKRLFECANGHKVSLTAGTVLHGTRQDLLTWFYAVFFISTLTSGISALQFQHQLGLKRYETAFQMLHKVRSTLVSPERELLHGEVEGDETFVGGKDPDRDGRGGERQYQSLPHIHRVFSNLKTWLLGTHHGRIEQKYLQAYLNEYTFRFNRRFWRGPVFLRAPTFMVQPKHKM